MARALESYFARARAIVLLTGNTPVFANVLAEPGTRVEKVARQSRSLREVTHQLGYLEQLYPDSIGEACFIDLNGEEFARAVRGEIAKPGDLSTVEEQAGFFAPTFRLAFGQVHQTRAVRLAGHEGMGGREHDPDSAGRWTEAGVRAFRGDRRELPARDGREQGIDARHGLRAPGRRRPQRQGRDRQHAPPADRRRRSATRATHASRVSPERADPLVSPSWPGTRPPTATSARPRATPTTGSSSRAPRGRPASFISGIGPVPIAMLAVALVFIALAAGSLRASRRELEAQATTDGLTGLGNRRKLLTDLGGRTDTATAEAPVVLTMFDLNGFKNYNDSFGHLAGDALLLRLGSALAEAAGAFSGRAYRPGGDEFCVIADAGHQHAMEEAACRALSEHGEGFTISAAFGSVVIPLDTGDVTEALRKADLAMYAQKHSGRATAGRQSSDVLMRALAERHPELGDHHDGVAELVHEVAKRLGIEGDELANLREAASLHDIGKVAIPDAIITKVGPLTDGRMDVHAPPHLDRRAHPLRRTRAQPGRTTRPIDTRSMGRHRLPRRARRRRNPTRRQDHRRLRLLRRNDLRTPLRTSQDDRRSPRRAPPLRRHTIRPHDRPHLRTSPRRPSQTTHRDRRRVNSNRGKTSAAQVTSR